MCCRFHVCAAGFLVCAAGFLVCATGLFLYVLQGFLYVLQGCFLYVLQGFMYVLQGFLYVLDCEGKTVEGWPLQMGDIQAQVAVGDVNGDGQLELIAADARGNVAAFTAKAEELWERHVASEVSQVTKRGSYQFQPPCQHSQHNCWTLVSIPSTVAEECCSAEFS